MTAWAAVSGLPAPAPYPTGVQLTEASVGTEGGTEWPISPKFSGPSNRLAGIVPGQTLAVGTYVRVERTTAGSATVTLNTRVKWYNSAGTLLSTTTAGATQFSATITNYQWVEGTHTAPANAYSARIEMFVTSSVTAANFEHKVILTGSRVGGAELGATNGADWDTNVTNVPANLASLVGTEALNNQDILDEIAVDGVLSRPEKIGSLKTLVSDLEARYKDLLARATAASLSTTALTTARTNWQNLLASYSPSYTDTNQETTIYTSLFAAGVLFPTNWSTTNASQAASGGYTTITDSSGTQTGRIAVTTTTTTGVKDYVFGLIVEKSTDTTIKRIELVCTGGVNKTGGFNFRLSDGATGGASNATVGGVEDLGTEWFVWGLFQTNTGNNSVEYRIYPAFNANLTSSTSAGSATGSVNVRNPGWALGTAVTALGRHWFAAKLYAYGKEMTALAKVISEYDATQASVQNPGSGVRIGDQRNLPQVAAQNLRYKNSGALSYSAAAGSPATATVSITASSSYIGSQTVSYSAMTSAQVTGTGGTSVTYYAYVDDPNYAGGTPVGGLQLLTSAQSVQMYQNDGRVYLGVITVTFPTSGTSGGDGGYEGGGGTCPEENQWVRTLRGWVQAKDIVKGDSVFTLEETWVDVESNESGMEFCYLLRGECSGIEVIVSESTPIVLRDKSIIKVKEIDGHELPYEVHTRIFWDRTFIEPLGVRKVCKISCHQMCYSAGSVPGYGCLTHNPKP